MVLIKDLKLCWFLVPVYQVALPKPLVQMISLLTVLARQVSNMAPVKTANI